MKLIKTLVLFALFTTTTQAQTYIPKDAPEDSVYIENGRQFKAGLTIESRREVGKDKIYQASKRWITDVDTSRYAITYTTIYKTAPADVLAVVIFRKVEKDYITP